jgi:hypothetical protein
MYVSAPHNSRQFFSSDPERPVGAVQSFLHGNPNFLLKLRMDADRVEPEPGVLIKKLQSSFPGVNDGRLALNALLVNKLRRPIGQCPRKGPTAAFARWHELYDARVSSPVL